MFLFKNLISQLILTKSVSGWPRCAFPSACPRLKALAEGGQLGSSSGWAKHLYALKQSGNLLFEKMWHLHSWEFNRGASEHEGCPSSSPLKMGMLHPPTSANADLYLTAQCSHRTGQSSMENTDHCHESRNGQGRARSQGRKGWRGVWGEEDKAAKKGRGWRREGMLTEWKGWNRQGVGGQRSQSPIKWSPLRMESFLTFTRASLDRARQSFHSCLWFHYLKCRG